MNRKDEIIKEIEENLGIEFPEEQVKIITHYGKPSNVISCAGSGKTTLMIASIAYLQKKYNIKSDRICTISFNTSAVEEIKTRYNALADKMKLGKDVTFKTFHALYYMILRYYKNRIFKNGNFNLIAEGESNLIFNRVFYENSRDKSDEYKDNIKSLRSYALNNLVGSLRELASTPRFINSGVDLEDYSNVIKAYNEVKEESNLLDFEDLQLKMLWLMENYEDARNRVQNAWDFWFIDEYQDICPIQSKILQYSLREDSNLVTIGDEDQCIYEFRGSKVDYIVDFPVYFNNSKRFIMDINYRCPEVILNSAKRMINKNKKRVNKNMKAYKKGGKVKYVASDNSINSAIYISEQIHDLFSKNIPLNEIAVLYRNTRQQIFLIDQLIERGIPIKVMKTSNLLHNHPIVKDIKNIIDLALDETDSYAFSKVFTKITKFVNKNQVNKVTREMNLTGKSWREYLLQDTNESIHKASSVLELIKNKISNKEYISTVIDDIEPLYYNYIKFITKDGSNMSLDEAHNVLKYLKFIGNNKTYKQFLFYLERVKSLVELYKKDKNAVTVTTMHTVKGLEFDYVFILDANDNIIPNFIREQKLIEMFSSEVAEEYIEQERRLMYVAMTRASKELTITFTREIPSRFIEEQLEYLNITDLKRSNEPVIIE